MKYIRNGLTSIKRSKAAEVYPYRQLARENTSDLVLPEHTFSIKLKHVGVRGVVIVALMAEERDRALLADVCTRKQWSVHFTDTSEQAWAVLNQLKAPVVLCDRDVPGLDWRQAIQVVASSGHHACAILLSRVADEYLWKEVTSKGGYDVLRKPLREEDVARSVKLAWSYWNSNV